MKQSLLLIACIVFVMSCKNKQSITVEKAVRDPDFEKADSLFSKDNDSAFFYFNKVATNSKDSLLIAKAYNYMAAIQSYAGDNFGAQESLLNSLKSLDDRNPKHHSCLASDYNELGLTSWNLKNYDAAITYYDASERFNQNPDYKLIGANNKALIYQSQGKYDQAIELYNEVIAKHEQTAIQIRSAKKEYARALANISFTKWLQNPSYNAEPGFFKALRIRDAEVDEWGLNSSYAHFTDYYASKNPDLALAYATKMYNIAKKIKSPDDQIDALQKLIKLSPPAATRKYFIIYQSLSDSLQTARNTAKNQFALIRYEAEKNKTENIKLQKDNNTKKYQIVTRELLLLVAGLILVLGSVAATLWFRKRKQKMELEAESALRESQLKTSKRVHDVVANGLYRVMTEIENKPAIDKEGLLDKIEELYEKSRDISYEKPTIGTQPFDQTISELLTSFSTEHTKVLIAGNTTELWETVTESMCYEIEHILQELMVNMKKHSSASDVAVRFERKNSRINIYYTDNGIGLTEDVQHKNGLRNTGNRIASIHGEITFDTKVDKGLKIQIAFPNP